MLGNGTHGDGDKTEAGVVIDDLLDRIKERARGVDDTGGGNKGSGGNGNGGGDDPLRGQPIDARTLIDAIVQMAGFTKTMILTAAERTAELLAEKTVNGLESERDALVATAKQLHENHMAMSDMNVRMAKAANDRFERIEARLAEIERALG
jgi:hypothetical protein